MCMWLHGHRPRSNSLWPHILSSPQRPREEDTTITTQKQKWEGQDVNDVRGSCPGETLTASAPVQGKGPTG